MGIWNQGPFGGNPPGGLCFDLMETIADRAGLEFAYTTLPALELIPAVVAGHARPRMLRVGRAGRRDPGVVFIGPILTNNEAIIVPAGDTTAYATLGDFAGKRIGTTANPGRQNHITAAGYERVVFDNAPAAAAALAAGQIDVWMVNGAEAPRLASETAGLRIADAYRATLVNYGMIGVGDGQLELMDQIPAGSGGSEDRRHAGRHRGSLERPGGAVRVPIPGRPRRYDPGRAVACSPIARRRHREPMP